MPSVRVAWLENRSSLALRDRAQQTVIMRIISFIAAATALLSQPTLAQAQRAPDSLAAIDQELAAAAAKGFGGAVIIQQGGRTLLSKGYGFADRRRKVPFTPETIAQIGSITKSQTGAALATLIAQGKVSLADRVSKYVPEAPEPGRSRTIAQLASHSSGLIDTCTNDFDRQPQAMLIGTCLARPLAHTPGEDHYSNIGYSVLALAIQRVTGKAWEEALRQRVWLPLGMKRIGFYLRGVPEGEFAHGYLKGVEQPLISRSISKLHGDDWALRGNGGIQASSRTMIRFLDGLLDPNSRLGPAARKLILAPIPGQSGDTREGFGFAFRYDEAGKLIRMGHSGSDGVFFSYLCWIPANDVRFYFVGNNGEDEVKPLLKDALQQATGLPPASRAGPITQ
jgi:CubicO group peptidase (beta-lactamase class C family)